MARSLHSWDCRLAALHTFSTVWAWRFACPCMARSPPIPGLLRPSCCQHGMCQVLVAQLCLYSLRCAGMELHAFCASGPWQPARSPAGGSGLVCALCCAGPAQPLLSCKWLGLCRLTGRHPLYAGTATPTGVPVWLPSSAATSSRQTSWVRAAPPHACVGGGCALLSVEAGPWLAPGRLASCCTSCPCPDSTQCTRGQLYCSLPVPVSA